MTSDKSKKNDKSETTRRRASRIVLILLVFGLLGGLGVPVSNLVIDMPSSPKLAAATKGDPLFAEVSEIIQGKCSHCHTPDTGKPFYASFPPAKSVVEQDINRGMRYLDLLGAFAPGAKVASETALAQIEHAISHDTMPPLKYVAMHWRAAMSDDARQAILTWTRKTRAAHYAHPDLAEDLRQAVLHPLPRTHAEDATKVALGKLLFNDKRLSRDASISCASCHDLAKGGTDQDAVATGVDDQKGPINSPTVFNALYNVKQFWDGRAKDLQEQAAGPVENPLEMAEKWDNVIKKLNADATFKAAFARSYPAGLSKTTVTDAIAIFEKTLITPDSRFDNFLRGQSDALSADEKAGLALFQEHGCATCHCGKALGGQSFELMGREKDYFAQRGKLTKEDNGLFNFTKREADRYKFKTPTLRNIALTFPYFHDAAAADLETAVKTMADVQYGQTLSKDEIAKIVSFLKTLTGQYQGKPLTPAAE